MERSPVGRHSRRQARLGRKTRFALTTGRLVTAMTIAATAGLVLPSSTAGAAGSAATARSGSLPLKVLLARANKLSSEIDNLGQQYDSLKIQLAAAKAQLKIAHLTEARDKRLLAIAESSVADIAAAGYMAGSVNPTLELLESRDPNAMLDRASILSELQQQNGTKMTLVEAASAAAKRAGVMAVQEAKQASRLSAAMKGKVAKIQAKEAVLNSKVYARAMVVYQQTGHYPNIHLSGNSVGVQALRWALSKVGDMYLWGAAGPDRFDCSGLVMWAYEHVGIQLDHFTGDQWNEGVHISRSQLQPGDLVFFFPDIGHVGLYVGNGLMVDAPQTGQPVQVQPVFWSAYVGAVRIV